MKFLTTYQRLKFSLKNRFIVDITCQKENHLARFVCGNMLVLCILSTVSYERSSRNDFFPLWNWKCSTVHVFKVNINISMFLKRMELLRTIIGSLDLGEQLTAKHI